MNIIRIIATMLLSLSFGTSSAEPSSNSSKIDATTKCSFSAFAQESDAAGLNVRQMPNQSSKIVGVLPPVTQSTELEGYKVKIELDILGSNHGWFKIANAKDNTALTGKSKRPVFSGSGWVSGHKLTVKTQAQYGYAKPNDTKSAYVVSLTDGSSLDNDEMVQAGQLISCEGDWALVEFSRDKLSAEMNQLLVVSPAAQVNLAKGHFRAWVNQICGNQETSCDGLAEQTVEH